jgi:hypothetical protein
LEKTTIGRPVVVAVVKIRIIGDPGCGSGYEQITVTATGCTTLVVGMNVALY